MLFNPSLIDTYTHAQTKQSVSSLLDYNKRHELITCIKAFLSKVFAFQRLVFPC